MSIRDVVILGATGSIGSQAIDIIRANPDRFRAVAISASGSHPARLAEDALDLGVHTVGVARGTAVEDVILHLQAVAQRRGTREIPKVVGGPTTTAELAELVCDVVLNAVAGSVGLDATLRTLRRGTTLALANKESLIAGGRMVTDLAAPGQLVPVDSEHSAMAQCLRAGRRHEVSRFILTASGGPFRDRTAAELDDVTLEQALAHPTWAMGLSNTLNSATLVNKGLELIEAHLLFDVPPEDIVVTVHPQSIIHSMIEYADGSTIAQASPPDMHLPIALALGWPERVPDASPTFDWSQSHSWTFEPLDDATFPAVQLARHSAKVGGRAPAAYNAANEEAIAAFADGRIRFGDIVRIVDGVLDQLHAHSDLSADAGTFDEVVAGENVAREHAQQLIATRQKDGQK